ncbi:MAG: RusA family crossover junction endodeoxyribonuclease [Patescibacteria group bacterium]|nr:RusA family crossover junction endodeoxyribonuclease [Patescibacteria group bacterium]
MKILFQTMFPMIQIFVNGLPKGQPRPRAFAVRGMVRMYDAGTAEGWKAAIADEWRRSVPAAPKIMQPVSLTLVFNMPRVKSHFNSKGNLKESAPKAYPKKPDADNLAKAVMDCMTQLGVWQDDDQVVILKVVKRYSEGNTIQTMRPGCEITLMDLPEI